MTLEEELHTNDMDEIIDSMTAYVYSRIKTIGVKDLEGRTADDFVGEVLMKVAEGERDWSKAKCSFKEFLFGCLRSHMNNFFKSFGAVNESELPDVRNEAKSGRESELKDVAINLLKEDGADDDEIEVFECWVDDITKPAEIAYLLEKKVKDVYNTTKRLSRRMPKIQTQIMKFV